MDLLIVKGLKPGQPYTHTRLHCGRPVSGQIKNSGPYSGSECAFGKSLLSLGKADGRVDRRRECL